MKKLFLSVFLFSLTGLAEDLSLGIPEYNGTGCPTGTAAAALSPDQKSLSILFDQFVVNAGGRDTARIGRKNCNIAIPVHVPQGMSISIFQIDYRGFNSLPYGAYSVFNVEYFFAGSRGPDYSKQWNGPVVSDYLLRNTLAANSVIWSPCGEDVILRANTRMTVNNSNQNEEAMSTVDSTDINTGLVFNIRWKDCR